MNGQKQKLIFRRNMGRRAAAFGLPRLRRNGLSRGQSAVEFALISTFALIVMLVGVQYALIGQAALAVSQGSAALARYAAASPGNVAANSKKTPENGTVTVTPGSVIATLLPSSILTGKNYSDLTVTIASISAASGTATNTPVLGDQCTISLSYNATNRIALPNPFLGIPLFPTTLTARDTELYE